MNDQNKRKQIRKSIAKYWRRGEHTNIKDAKSINRIHWNMLAVGCLALCTTLTLLNGCESGNEEQLKKQHERAMQELLDRQEVEMQELLERQAKEKESLKSKE